MIRCGIPGWKFVRRVISERRNSLTREYPTLVTLILDERVAEIEDGKALNATSRLSSGSIAGLLKFVPIVAQSNSLSVDNSSRLLEIFSSQVPH